VPNSEVVTFDNAIVLELIEQRLRLL